MGPRGPLTVGAVPHPLRVSKQWYVAAAPLLHRQSGPLQPLGGDGGRRPDPRPHEPDMDGAFNEMWHLRGGIREITLFYLIK